jgi:hypothetical protein
VAYGDESDAGFRGQAGYPIPDAARDQPNYIEGGVPGGGSNGDRHLLIVDRERWILYELFATRWDAGRSRWEADSGAIFDLSANDRRPDGWTSADAAGLPIYPGLVTYEEASSGVIDHAIRVTFEQTRRGYVSPATHYASDSCNRYRPSMGMRLRLAPSYDISGMTGTARVIAVAMKTYGLIVADNGSNWYISGSTDRRWNDENLNQLKEIPGAAFQMIDSGPETSPC